MTAPQQPFHTVLVVDPSLLRRRQLRQMLKHLGVKTVLEAESGPAAVPLAAEQLVDLAFAVWDGPDPAGQELMRALRRKHGQLPVVILDRGLPQQAVVAAIKAGAAGRLGLPLRQQSLADLLARIGEDPLESARPSPIL